MFSDEMVSTAAHQTCPSASEMPSSITTCSFVFQRRRLMWMLDPPVAQEHKSAYPPHGSEHSYQDVVHATYGPRFRVSLVV